MATTETKLCAKNIKYLTHKEALVLEQELCNDFKCSIDQVVELSGLSVAMAISRTFPPSTHDRVLIICGPGRNGAIGLVAARHLSLFGYKAAIYYPVRKPNKLYENLFSQAMRYGVDLIQAILLIRNVHIEYELLVDALYGIHFNSSVIPPLLEWALEILIQGKLPVSSVDIPCGWHVDNGPDTSRKALKPVLLVSLSAPKLCARPELLKGARHFLGGRFIPPSITKKYNLSLSPYPDQDQVVEICDTE